MEVSFTLPTQEMVGYGLAVIMFAAWVYVLGVCYSTRARVSRLMGRIDLHSEVLEEHARHIADLKSPKKPARKKPVAKKAPKKAVQPPTEQPKPAFGTALSQRLSAAVSEPNINDVIPSDEM